MQRTDEDDLRRALSLAESDDIVDNREAERLRSEMAVTFRQQLTLGAPTNSDESALRRLSAQLKTGKLVVKLFLRHTLHAKLYLHYRDDVNNPITGFVGSSNLTMAGLVKQGELNLDVLEHDACLKLQKWFEDRWEDQFCVDISAELAQVIDESWAREEPLSPYLVYLKMAYHLSREAQSGMAEFDIPGDLGNTLFEFQTKAVQIAAHHLNKRGGVLIGDVVGLGKTLMATALARVFQDDQHTDTLIICPKNLVKMWDDYVSTYRLLARVVPLTSVERELPHLRRYRVVLIDESQNLRNREGMRYKIVADYIEKNDSRVILLSATPYNKGYDDLASQLALFVDREESLGIRPEAVIRELGEVEFVRRHQARLDTLAAFEQSPHADDWRDLMRRYMVRRTRSFIQDNYALTDPTNGRQYLEFRDGRRSYFPVRVPRTVGFELDQDNPDDPYGTLYSDPVVDAIEDLRLPRYGLGNYLDAASKAAPDAAEGRVIDGLGRAGIRLRGFCRTNFFKRLESGGPAFLQSVERHALRNFVYLHALETNRPLPIGAQDAVFLDDARYDEDVDSAAPLFGVEEADDDQGQDPSATSVEETRTEADFRVRAAEVYASYEGKYQRRFRWIRPELFNAEALAEDLLADAHSLISVLAMCGVWEADRDPKLASLLELLESEHPTEKVLVFTQFADTARYLAAQLAARGVDAIEGVTGTDADPTGTAWRFSPVSNQKRDSVSEEDELRILIATDVLSEGQNLQDCAIVVNYDLPWAIIRLVQRAGRVDRIGQQAEEIQCYSFLPAEGIERIIRLRQRVGQRLQQNAEVVGSDEAFFEEQSTEPVLDIYNEKAGIFDGDAESDVDLGSQAYEVWKAAVEADPSLKKTIESLPNVVYATKAHVPDPEIGGPDGVLIYMETAQGNDALAWVDEEGVIVSQSILGIFRAAACDPNTPGIARHKRHHELVKTGVADALKEQSSPGGSLGRPSGARFKTYERLKRFEGNSEGTLFASRDLSRAIEEILRFPLFQSAIDTLNRQIKAGVEDPQLAELVIGLRRDGRLCQVSDDEATSAVSIICSMGLFPPPGP